MKMITQAAFVAILASTAAVWALGPAGNVSEQGKAPMADGEVRKVDRDAQKVTIKHGPIANLDMPGMTMVFRVKEPAMLERLKPGAKIRFNAEKIGGAITVTEFEEVK